MEKFVGLCPECKEEIRGQTPEELAEKTDVHLDTIHPGHDYTPRKELDKLGAINPETGIPGHFCSKCGSYNMSVRITFPKGFRQPGKKNEKKFMIDLLAGRIKTEREYKKCEDCGNEDDLIKGEELEPGMKVLRTMA